MAEPRSCTKTKGFHLTILSPHLVPEATGPKSLELWYKIKVLHSKVTLFFETVLRWLIFSSPWRGECCPLLQCIFPHLTSLKERENMLRLGGRKKGRHRDESSSGVAWTLFSTPSLTSGLQNYRERQGGKVGQPQSWLRELWCGMILFLFISVILTNQY